MEVRIPVSDKRIETERLVLRPWTEADVDDFYEYASVEGVGEMAGWRHHESRQVSEEILRSFIDEEEVFAIVCRQNNKVIGSFGLHRSWANEVPEYRNLKLKEIGYVLSKEYWGQGLMTEAVSEVIKTSFGEYGLEALTVCHFSANSRSRRVIEKCGFCFVEEEEKYLERLGIAVTEKKYILCRDLYDKNAKATAK